MLPAMKVNENFAKFLTHATGIIKQTRMPAKNQVETFKLNVESIVVFKDVVIKAN